MKTVLTVDAPDLIEAVTRASRIAPKSGAAFDKAAGVLFETTDEYLIIKASDLMVNYRERIPIDNLKGSPPEPFRLPSNVLSKYLASLPTGEDSKVTLSLEPMMPGNVVIKSANSTATLTVIRGVGFPQFEWFDPDGLTMIEDFMGRVKQVQWAASRKEGPMSGVHVDGHHLTATDTMRLASIPCEVAVDAPVTAPLALLSSALGTGPVRLTVTENKLLLMPDNDTQLTCQLFEGAYPAVQRVWDMTADNVVTEIKRQTLLDALSRINALFMKEQFPSVSVRVSGSDLTLTSVADEFGTVTEELKMDTPLEGDPIEWWFDPSFLFSAVSSAKAATTVELGWPPKFGIPLTVKDDASNYAAIVAPRSKK